VWINLLESAVALVTHQSNVATRSTASEWVNKRTLRGSSEVVMWRRCVLWKKRWQPNRKSSRVSLTYNLNQESISLARRALHILLWCHVSCIEVWAGHNVIMTKVQQQVVHQLLGLNLTITLWPSQPLPQTHPRPTIPTLPHPTSPIPHPMHPSRPPLLHHPIHKSPTHYAYARRLVTSRSTSYLINELKKSYSAYGTTLNALLDQVGRALKASSHQ
jgi:hypothetical protein